MPLNDKEFMRGTFAAVSINHVVSVRIITSFDCWSVEALTTDWAIILDRFMDFDKAQDFLEECAIKLRDR